jgi:hypothetical protein
MLTTGELYNDLGGDYFIRQNPDRTTRPHAHFPDRPVIRRAAPTTTTADRRPGRASPVPAATVQTFHAPYAGRFFRAALPGSTPLPWPSPRTAGLGSSSPHPKAGY